MASTAGQASHGKHLASAVLSATILSVVTFGFGVIVTSGSEETDGAGAEPRGGGRIAGAFLLAGAFAAALFIGGLAGFYPGVGAARLSPTAALGTK